MKNCHIKFFISICFTINSIFPMNVGENITKRDYEAYRIRFMESEQLNSNNYNFNNETAYRKPTTDSLQENNAIELCTRQKKQFEPDLLDIVINSAPEKLQKMANILKKKTLDKKAVRSIIPQIMVFLGKPGLGKSTLAQAIAQYCNMGCTLIKISDVYDKYKDSGSHNLREIFSIVRKFSDPHIVILDEMQFLVKKRNHEDKEEEAARTLWSALDEFEDNLNLFFIGTANDITDFPPQLRSRISTAVFTIDLPSDKTRKKIVNYYISTVPAHINAQFNEKEINYLIKKTNGLSYRELQKTFLNACSEAGLENVNALDQVGGIKLEIIHIENAVKFVKKIRCSSNNWYSDMYQIIKPYIGPTLQIIIPIVINNILSYCIQKYALQRQLQLSMAHHQDSIQLAISNHHESMELTKLQHLQTIQQNLEQSKLFHKEIMAQNLKIQEESFKQSKEYNEIQLQLAKDNSQKSSWMGAIQVGCSIVGAACSIAGIVAHFK